MLAARGTAGETREPEAPPGAAAPTAAAPDPVEHVGETTAGPVDPADASRHEGLELEERLGEGEGTRTWRARERSTREEFAVTFAVLADPVQRRVLEARFGELAEQWSGEEHPHLVRVRATLGEADRPAALVTEYAEGVTLAERMRSEGRLAPEEVSPVLAAAARALSRLHERGWVHGRLAAEHVLLTPERGVLVDGYGARSGARCPGPAWGLGERPESPAAFTHRARAQGPVLEPDVPAPGAHDDAAGPGRGTAAPGADPTGSPGVPRSPGESTLPGRVEKSGETGGLGPAEDVHALGVMGWRALTGRLPGPDSHRVPLTLMCPTAPRHLVLMLEAALCDDPAERPAAHELAAGFDAAAPLPGPPRRPRRPEERMTPEVIRADGTVVRSRRVWRPLRAEHPSSSGGGDVRRDHRGRGGGRVRGNGGRRAGSHGHSAGVLASEAALSHPGRRWWPALAAALVVVATVWGLARWAAPGDVVADPASSAASLGRESAAGAATDETGAGGERGSEGRTPTPRPSGARPGSPQSTAGSSGQAQDRGSPGRSTGSGAPHAPGASMQDLEREAQQAVRDLVAARAAALSAGDESAVASVYVPGSRLAAKDREVIRRAGAQDTGGTGFTAFSGISMDVVELREESTARGPHVSPAEAARTRTYRTEVVTRGWHGGVPTGAHVTRKGGEAVQTLRISVVQTPEGWKLTDVTPVADGR
ncbi:hypothetical protein EAE32_11090 [Kocuria tytonicola]|uniref:Protein kinase domain-containing protein n=1 Tax=Kocuria tytonicola TaxID=2055946 RepID=A0A3L9KWE5_9MICC|nr:hypothetical protein EAE32_11090 [Kocuria tytonicola]